MQKMGIDAEVNSTRTRPRPPNSCRTQKGNVFCYVHASRPGHAGAPRHMYMFDTPYIVSVLFARFRS